MKTKCQWGDSFSRIPIVPVSTVVLPQSVASMLCWHAAVLWLQGWRLLNTYSLRKGMEWGRDVAKAGFVLLNQLCRLVMLNISLFFNSKAAGEGGIHAGMMRVRRDHLAPLSTRAHPLNFLLPSQTHCWTPPCVCVYIPPCWLATHSQDQNNHWHKPEFCYLWYQPQTMGSSYFFYFSTEMPGKYLVYI